MLTNHCLVLLCIASDPELRVRDIAERVGITERATQTILSDLDHCGYVERVRDGRRNRYRVQNIPIAGHPLVHSATIRDLLEALSPAPEPSPAS
jgi:DNA-binding IclR family transcriptional regulator